MVHGRLAVGALLAAAAAASPAFAAPRAEAAPDKFSVQFNLRAEHDTNLLAVSEAESKARGLSPEDTVYTPSVNLNLNLPVSRQTVFLRGNVGYVFHDQNKSLDSETLNIDGGVRARLSICAVTADMNYQRRLSSFDDIVLGPTTDNIIETKTYTLQGNCARSTGIGVTGSISHTDTNNDQNLLAAQDYQSDNYQVGLTYSKPRLGTLTVFGSHNRTKYENALVALGQSGGYESTDWGLTYDRRLGARISGTATLSYSHASGLDAPTPTTPSIDFDGVTYSLALTYRPTSRAYIEGSFGRDVSPSNRLGNSYDVGERYRLTGSYDLGTRITASLGAEQRDVDSQGTAVFAGNLTNSRTKSVFGSLTYHQSKRISLSLDAAHEERNTNLARFNSENTRVGVSAGVTY